MAMIVQHKYITPPSDDNDIKGDEEKSNNKEAIIVCGTTGTGKSSLIKLFCGDNVKVGHKTKSETQESTLFLQKNSNNKYWLDSQGANDSKGVDDEKVLTDILKRLYDENVCKIKVIWCVSGDMCREKNEFRTQAKFIKSLGNNVWKSCLIIKKKGAPTPQDINGVIDAANHCGAHLSNNDERLFGFTALEVVDEEKDINLKTLNKYIKDPTARKAAYKDSGYLTNQEILQETSRKLSNLPSLAIEFTLKQCEKCGVKGDPRFVYAPCHPQMEKYHPKLTEQYHKESTKTFHPRSTFSRHTGQVSTEKTKDRYHPGELGVPVGKTMLQHFGTFGIYTGARAISGDDFFEWTCCGEKSDSSGCKKEESYTTKWSCCNRPGNSTGCITEYGCCGKPAGSEGCTTLWICCDAPKHNRGCERRYLCCKKDLGDDGCEDRCRSCHGEWGKSNGCTKTSKK